ncbi:hypothetical protein [Aeromicrobium sp.]|uniref:hypothetical protein n=1 Tax=Aeromicrobium sp. TaxID=1871063 RepID=UPI0030C16FE0
MTDDDPHAAGDESDWAQPIRVETSTVDHVTWDSWRADVSKGITAARRLSAVASSTVFTLAAASGVVLLPRAWLAATVLYCPLLAWVTWTLMLSAVSRRLTRRTLRSMRARLAPAQISTFEPSVLLAILSRTQVPAAKHHRFVTVALVPEQATVSVAEYDMTRFPGGDIPNAGQMSM